MAERKLSGLEQRVYFAAREAKKGIITFEILASMQLCSRQTLYVVLNRMVKKKFLFRVKRGVYSVATGYFQPVNGVEDAYHTAQLIFPGYLAFATALNLHGLLDEFAFTAFVATTSTSASRVLGQVEVRAVALGKSAVGFVRMGDYTVSTRAKTLFDCLRFPDYSGGYSKITKAFFFAKLSAEEWQEFCSYIAAFSSKATAQRAGYLLELIKKKAGVKIPAFVVDCLKKKSGRKKVLLEGIVSRPAKVNARWMVADNIGQQNLLSWMRG